jgi:hypothetical protein
LQGLIRLRQKTRDLSAAAVGIRTAHRAVVFERLRIDVGLPFRPSWILASD